MTSLVTHADQPFGRGVALQFLRRGERVRAQVAVPHARHTYLRRAGAEVVLHDLYSSHGFASLEWREVSRVVHASVSGAVQGREAVLSLSDLGTEKLVQAAATAQVQRVILLHPPSPGIQSRLEHSPLPYTLLCSEPELEVTFSGGGRGRVLERRHLVAFMPLSQVVEVVVAAASGEFRGVTLTLPTLTRRYSHLIDEVERLLRLPEPPVEASLLAEIVMGSPYKLVTPGVARALELNFPRGYAKRTLSAPNP